MKVFVTGATGFIGFDIVKDLIAAGHQVTGLARSEASAQKLISVGAKAHRGDVEDLESLRQGAAQADGVIHTAFYHQISHIPLGTRLRVFFGGAPTGIVHRFLSAALEMDRRALETMGKAMKGKDRALVGTFATMSMKPGQLAFEDDKLDPKAVGALRGGHEKIMRNLASEGVRTSIVRVAPMVHGAGDRNGFIPMLIQTAIKKKESAYIEDGQNRWPAVHRSDAARLFRLALEKGQAGKAYHAAAEEGVPFKDVANLIGRRLNLPVVSKKSSEAAKQFSFLSDFVKADNPTSSQLTQKRLGWQPTQPGVLLDMDQADYFRS